MYKYFYIEYLCIRYRLAPNRLIIYPTIVPATKEKVSPPILPKYVRKAVTKKMIPTKSKQLVM